SLTALHFTRHLPISSRFFSTLLFPKFCATRSLRRAEIWRRKTYSGHLPSSLGAQLETADRFGMHLAVLSRLPESGSDGHLNHASWKQNSSHTRAEPSLYRRYSTPLSPSTTVESKISSELRREAVAFCRSATYIQT